MQKKLLLSLLLISFQLTALSQTYFPISQEGAIFTCYHYDPSGPPPPPDYTSPSPYHYVLYNTGDTIWNGIVYKKQYKISLDYDTTGTLIATSSPVVYRLLRDDITLQKTFCINAFYTDSTEYLLQDFSLSVGDSFLGFSSSTLANYYHIISEDSILIGSSYRRVWNIDSDDLGIYLYPLIQGIGIFGKIEYGGPGIIVMDGIICYNDGLGNGYSDSLSYSNGDSLCITRYELERLLGIESLPLHLLTFSATATCDIVTLEWSLTNDDEHTYNIIQRSTDALNWQDIAKINIENTGTQIKKMIYNDNYQSNQNTYYRIVSVSESVSKEYSPIQSVKSYCSEVSNISLSPNPATNSLHLQGTASDAIISIYDLQGKILLTQNNCGTQCDIDISTLSHGFYLAKVSYHDSTQSLKFIKTNQ